MPPGNPSLANVLAIAQANEARAKMIEAAREANATRVTWPLLSNVIRLRERKHAYQQEGLRIDPVTKLPRNHDGWDLEAQVGTICFAVSRGEVIFVRNYGDYGLQVCASFHATVNGVRGEWFAFYAHLLSTFVKVGDKVHPDTPLGLTGKSGNAKNMSREEEHLHFEIRKRGGQKVDPELIYGITPLWYPILRTGLWRWGPSITDPTH
jgi:murein DD-endopeptidase MepM/ murein hydrolase activator NlpD